MFPGMMRGPEPLPEHVSQQQFWKQINRFVAITTLTIAVALGIRFVERRALDSMTKSF